MRTAAPRGRGEAGGGQGRAGRRTTVRRWRLVRARSDAVPPSVRRFMRRARQRRLRAALPWMLASGVLVLAGLGSWVVLGTGLLGVREIRVAGVELLTPAQVREAAAVADGTPLARVNLDAVRARIAELPPVERVTVRRDWPGALLIEVVERTAVAAVPQDGQYALVDRSGVVFRTLTEPPADLPTLRVAAPGPDDQATRAGLMVLAVLTPQLREQLAEVSVEAPARIRLILHDGRTIIWGDPSKGEEKAQVATALLDQKGDVIDVSAPDVVTIN